jgi:hypothetical protein
VVSNPVSLRKEKHLKPFRIKKEQLIEGVRQNRDAHRSVYESAMAGYRNAATQFFTEQLERALQSRPFMTMFTEPMPEDHTEDYDVMLDGWTMTEDDEIELSVQEFRQYVRDEWGWKREFTATASNYLREPGA